MAGNSKKDGQGAIIWNPRQGGPTGHKISHFLFLFYLTFPQQSALIITSSFLKSSPLLASTTGHILSFLLLLWLLLSRLVGFNSLLGYLPFPLYPLSVGSIFCIHGFMILKYLSPASLVWVPVLTQHLQIVLSESPHTQRCPKSTPPNLILFQGSLSE